MDALRFNVLFNSSSIISSIDDCKTDFCLNCEDVINSFTCQCAKSLDGPTCANSLYNFLNDLIHVAFHPCLVLQIHHIFA